MMFVGTSDQMKFKILFGILLWPDKYCRTWTDNTDKIYFFIFLFT